ncbi:hypothetical protein N7535_008171 [Penicillium sp. DV-2018c]|nr:hypothetical protein N7535_008171 [Penicillium sp. DV-2018c]
MSRDELKSFHPCNLFLHRHALHQIPEHQHRIQFFENVIDRPRSPRISSNGKQQLGEQGSNNPIQLTHVEDEDSDSNDDDKRPPHQGHRLPETSLTRSRFGKVTTFEHNDRNPSGWKQVVSRGQIEDEPNDYLNGIQGFDNYLNAIDKATAPKNTANLGIFWLPYEQHQRLFQLLNLGPTKKERAYGKNEELVNASRVNFLQAVCAKYRNLDSDWNPARVKLTFEGQDGQGNRRTRIGCLELVLPGRWLPRVEVNISNRSNSGSESSRAHKP